jgi:hypothetical protein
MKTPQEEAERLIMRVALHDDKNLDEIIPLAALLTVARAAAMCSKARNLEEVTTIAMNLNASVEALRATGKVEL